MSPLPSNYSQPLVGTIKISIIRGDYQDCASGTRGIGDICQARLNPFTEVTPVHRYRKSSLNLRFFTLRGTLPPLIRALICSRRKGLVGMKGARSLLRNKQLNAHSYPNRGMHHPRAPCAMTSCIK